MQYRDTPEMVPILRNFYTVILGTKLSPLFLATPLAIASHCAHWGHVWTFVFGCLALVPLAERVSFLTEQIAFYTGPTVGGLLNATCGNATELIIAVFALFEGKVDIVKYSLLGSILSNLLLVLGTSLFCGGLKKENKQKYDGTQANVNFLLLFLGLFCHMLPLMLRYTLGPDTFAASPILDLSRVNSIVMLVAYFSYLFFQLYTHRDIFEAHEVEDVHMPEVARSAVIGFSSALFWLAAMTGLIALLSEFVVGTIEDASSSWGISVSFLSIILLPIVGNAAEHASAIIFAWRDELDISLGVALGSATQISIFVVPLAVIVAWIGGIRMDLDLNLIETGTLALSIVATAFALQDGKSHYMKGLSLIFCYVALSVCFFFVISPLEEFHSFTVGSLPSFTGSYSV